MENSTWIRPLQQEIGRVIVGQTHLLDTLLIALLTNGHVLLEGVPGLAKTLALKTLAGCVAVRFKRLQFTPDMLPADIVGTMIYNPQDGEFRTKHGPIFSNLILADEINRAPAKVQSALLEAMQERQVTIGEQTYPLEGLFLVMATQNPIEQEGTYPLPEAQVDRFMLKVKITYPLAEEEREVMHAAVHATARPIQPVLQAEDILSLQEVVRSIYIDDQIMDYVLKIVRATRKPSEFGLRSLTPLIEYGASPRASIYLATGARAIAFLKGRGHVTPQDVKDIAFDVLRHRVLLTYEAEAERTTSEDVIKTILGAIPVP
ncbi:MAG: AAA family ATPase [Thermoguttaceae bacterium]